MIKEIGSAISPNISKRLHSRGIRTTAEIHNLQAGRLEFRDIEHFLEVLVEYIKQAITETPQEEERSDEGDWEDELPARQKPALHRGHIHRHASCHDDCAPSDPNAVKEGVVVRSSGRGDRFAAKGASSAWSDLDSLVGEAQGENN